MKKWKPVTGVALVFVLGVVAGSLGTAFYHKYLFTRHKGDPSARKAFILKRFSQDLDLTEDQKNEFKSIIDQLEDKREEHFRKSRSELDKVMDQGFSQMKRVLSAKQQKKFDALKEKFEKRRKARAKFGPPRPR
jgi:Spy/CpxP family protein refolding chaperone